MTNESTPIYTTGHSGADLLYQEAQINSNRRAPTPNDFRTFRIPNPDGRGYRQDVLRWEYQINDVSGGLDSAIAKLTNRLMATDGIDGRHADTLCLSPLVNTATTPDPSSIQNVSAVDVFGATAIGIGTSLLIPTSATNRALTALTYTGTGGITYVYRGTIGGTTEALWICRAGANNVEILSDLASTPTSTGTITSTNTTWGIVESPINEDTPGGVNHIMYIGSTIALKRSDNTFSTAPTAVLTNFNGGGYPVHPHMFGIGGKRMSAWFVKPRSHQTTSMLAADSSAVLGDIWYLNAEGQDPLPFHLPIPVRLARRWRNGIVASDHRSLYWHNGNVEDLQFGYKFQSVTEREYLIYNIHNYVDRLLLDVVERDVSADAPARIAVYEYIPETDAYYQLTPWTTVTGGVGDITGSPTGVIAREHSTLYRNATIYAYDEANWRYFNLTPPNWNPFNMSRNTGSATAGVVYPFATSGTALSSIMPLPGIEGFPSVVYEVQCLGELRGTFSSGNALKVEVAEQTTSGMSFTGAKDYHFLPSDVVSGQSWTKSISQAGLENTAAIDKLQLRFTLTQGSEVRMTSNALPIIVRGVCFLDRKPRRPIEVLPGNLVLEAA